MIARIKFLGYAGSLVVQRAQLLVGLAGKLYSSYSFLVIYFYTVFLSVVMKLVVW